MLDRLSFEGRRLEKVEPWLALAVVAWCGWRLAAGLGPDPYYNSDSGAPMLLVQGLGSGPFTLFYPGQDRFGAWPFLIARWLRLDSPEAYHAFSTIGLLSALFPLSRMLGSPGLALLTLVPPLFLNHVVSWNVFEIGQPYLWQIAALCWAWWACRAAVERSSPLRLAGLAVAASLAIWMSTLSIPALAGLLVIEAVRAKRWQLPGPLLAVGLGALVEGQLRRLYHAYCARNFGQAYLSVLRFDRWHVRPNLAAVATGCWNTGVALPLLVGTLLVVRPGLDRRARANQAGLVWLALVTLPALVLVQHFRASDFSARYFAFPAFWALTSTFHGAAVLVLELARRWRPAVLGVALVAVAIACPVSPAIPLADVRADAARLTGSAPRIYLDGYWETYLLASLAPRGALVPLPRQGQSNRFPMLQSALQPGREAVAPCRLDQGDGTAEQYGALLRRTEAAVLPGTREPLCLYGVERAASPLPRPRR